MNRSEKNVKDSEYQSWKNVVDRVIDYISSSKSTLQILNDKLAIPDEKNGEAAKQNAKDTIRKKLLKEFFKDSRNKDYKISQLHLNEYFRDNTDSNVRCSAQFSEGQFENSNESTKQRRTSMNFLDEQYNLTKQAIARRYRPQMKITSISTKNDLIRDYFQEPYNQNCHRITNVVSEKIPVYQLKKKHTKKTEKKIPAPAVPPKSSKIQTFVIYEKS